MATPRVASTWHDHTERGSVTPHNLYVPSLIKGREVRVQKHSTGMSGTQSKLHISTHMESKTYKSCKTLYDTPPNMIAPRDR